MDRINSRTGFRVISKTDGQNNEQIVNNSRMVRLEKRIDIRNLKMWEDRLVVRE